ncbi:hypothetical protein ACOZE3_15525 [Streptomyces cinereoruber]|uniref:hypothetical protein n=1 Tax=Streptomyces cinereoruber TaxID=67260 RepID=UPI003BF5BFD6
MMQLSAQATHAGQVFLLIWGVLALAMGSVLASKKGSAWFHGLTVSGLRGRPEQQARAQGSGGVRAIGVIFVVSSLIGIVAAVVLLIRG